MKRVLLSMSCILLAMCMMLGCGNKYELNSDSVTLNDDGSVNALMVESFDQPYYSEDELMGMVNDEVAEFNVKYGKDKIKVVEHKLKDGKMILEMKFADVTAYNNYMPDNIYVGTISGAAGSGYDLNRSLNVAGKDGATIGKSELLEMGDKKVCIVNKATNIRVPDKIKYYSQGMELKDKTTAAAEVANCYFIIY